jgi:hypothetical protein
MIFHKTMVILMLAMCVTPSVPLQAVQHTGDYSESYVLNVQSCHYLEFVQEFTDHSFLVHINSSCLPSDSKFLFTGRYTLSGFSFPLNSPNELYVPIIFEVYEIVGDMYLPCDLYSEKGIGFVEILFDTYTGHWNGDDHLGDESGYGRLNSCDDGSIDMFERDFELCFSVDVVNLDGDAIPGWIEEHMYGTDPFLNDAFGITTKMGFLSFGNGSMDMIPLRMMIIDTLTLTTMD